MLGHFKKKSSLWATEEFFVGVCVCESMCARVCARETVQPALVHNGFLMFIRKLSDWLCI